MTALTDITPNIVIFMIVSTFLIISFRQAAWLLFRAFIFVAGLLVCAATGVFSVNFMLLGISSPSLQWYDIGTLMYYARFIFGGMVIFAQVKSFISWQRGQGGKWLCIGATAVSVFMSVYTFHTDITRSAATAEQSNVNESVKYSTLFEELERLKELRDNTAKEKDARIKKLMSLGRFIKQSEQEREYFDNRISDFNIKIEALANELDQYAENKKKGGTVVSTKGTFEGIAKDIVFFFALDADFWQPRLEMALQYLMIAGISLLADCAAMSFIFFGLGFLDEVREAKGIKAHHTPVWLLQIRPQAQRIMEIMTYDAWKKMKRVPAVIRAKVHQMHHAFDALPVDSDADFKEADVSNDASIIDDVKSDVPLDIKSNKSDSSRRDVSIKVGDALGCDANAKAGDASENDASIKVSDASENDASLQEIKVDGVTVHGFDDAETAKQFMIDAYQEKGSYRAVYQTIGVSPNPSSARMLKSVLDEAGVEHGQKRKVNGKSRRPLKKSLERPIAEAASLIQ